MYDFEVKEPTTGNPWMDRVIDRSDFSPLQKERIKRRIAFTRGVDGSIKWYLERLKGNARLYAKYKGKLKNPISDHTGKPLTPATIKNYAREIPEKKRYILEYKDKIRILLRIKREQSTHNVVNLDEYRTKRAANGVCEQIEAEVDA